MQTDEQKACFTGGVLAGLAVAGVAYGLFASAAEFGLATLGGTKWSFLVAAILGLVGLAPTVKTFKNVEDCFPE